jgi:hypothetical protein
MREIDVVAARLARAQHGMFSRRQLIADGGSERAIDHRLQIGQLFDDAGLPAPVHEYRVNLAGHRYRIGFAYPDLMIAIELDGRGHELQFDEDPVRANRLAVGGWLVLRFTWRRLVEDPDGIVADVFAALRQRSGVHHPHAV